MNKKYTYEDVYWTMWGQPTKDETLLELANKATKLYVEDYYTSRSACKKVIEDYYKDMIE